MKQRLGIAQALLNEPKLLICDNIAVLNKGKIVLSGAISDIKAKGSKEKVLVEFKDESELQQFIQLPEFEEFRERAQVENATLMVSAMDLQATFTFIMILLTDHHLVPCKLEVIEPTLEDLFMEVVG